MAVGGLLGAASYGWLERHVRLGVIMRGGLIIETLTHLALALTRWAWFALIVFVIFGAHALSGERPRRACGSGPYPPSSRAAWAASTSPVWSAAS